MQFFRQVFGGAWITQGVWVVAELGIADILAKGPQSAEELAEQTHARFDALYRVMRALASVGIFAQDADNRFSLTPISDMLRSDVAGSQRAFAIMMGAEFHTTWGELLHTVRTGEQGFRKGFGMTFFEYMTKHPERHSIYDAAMHGIHGVETGPMLDAYHFEEFRTVADIGGGNGSTLAAILERHTGTQGILFDLPAVAERAHSFIADSGLSGRCRVEGGDFFSSVPEGADAYVMRHVIHDWEDSEAVTILRNCREAMNAGGKVLVVEMVVPPGNEPGFGKWLDLMMMLVGGRERTGEEYRRLFSAAGLKLNRGIPTASDVSILECVQAA
ncbi:MAG: methyltransferase [Nitrospirae bacterium]|nr:methyltransferase [Nitrospirota bacterium]